MSNKIKVKQYIRKGKIVNSYDRNRNKLLRSTAVGALAGGLGVGVPMYSKLKNSSLSKIDKTGVLLNVGLAGTVVGGLIGNQIGKKMFMNKEDRKQLEEKQLNLQKKLIPYQDKDLSGLQGGISGAQQGAMLGGVGSIVYGLNKLKNKVKKLEPGKKFADSKLLKKISNEPELARRYGSKIFKGAGKAAIIAGLVGGGLGYLNSRNMADKLNKKLGKKDVKENKKQKVIKIAKALGAAAIGGGLGYRVGLLINKNTLNKNIEAGVIKKLENTFDVMRQANEVKVGAKLRQAQSILAEEIRSELRNRPNVKLLGEGELSDDVIGDIVKEKLKRKGFKMGSVIGRRARQNSQSITRLENYLKGGYIKHGALLYAPAGAALGVGIYKGQHNKKDKQPTFSSSDMKTFDFARHKGSKDKHKRKSKHILRNSGIALGGLGLLGGGVYLLLKNKKIANKFNAKSYDRTLDNLDLQSTKIARTNNLEFRRQKILAHIFSEHFKNKNLKSFRDIYKYMKNVNRQDNYKGLITNSIDTLKKSGNYYPQKSIN